MANSVRIAVGVADSASTPLDRIRDKFERLQKAGGKGFAIGVGAAATTAALNIAGEAVGRVTDFLGDSVHKAMEAERVNAALTQSLKANVAGWNGDTTAIEAAAKANEAYGFTSIETKQSLIGLVGASHSVGEAIKVQAIAMDLARYKNISLAEATDVLTKFEGGRFRGLAALGIAVDKHATKEQALAAVEAIAAGQREKFASTTEGAMASASAAVDALQVKIGEGLLPVIKDLATQAVPALDAFETGFAAIGKGIEKIGQQQGPAQQNFPLLSAAIGLLADAANHAVNPLANLNDIIDNSPRATEQAAYALSQLAFKIPKAWADAEHGVVTATKTIADKIGEMDEKRQISEALTGIDGIVREKLVMPWIEAEAALTPTLDQIVGDIETARRGINDALSKPIADLFDPKILRAHVDTIKAELANLLKQPKTPQNKEQALSLQKDLAQTLADLSTFGNKASEAAKLAGQAITPAIIKGLKSSDPKRKLDAEIASQRIFDGLSKLGPDAKTWGMALGNSFIAGIVASIAAGKRRVNTALTEALGQQMIGNSPPPEGPLHLIDVGGFNIGKAWAGGVAAGAATFAMPSFGMAPSLGTSAGMTTGGGSGSFGHKLDVMIGYLSRIVAQEPLAATPQTARGDLARMSALLPGGRL